MTLAAKLCERYTIPLSDEGRSLCGDGLSPRQYFDRLREAGQLADARRFLAYVLGRRRALRWAYACAAEVLGSDAPLLAEVKRFLDDPTDERRTELRDRGLAEPPESPAGYLALAAFLSGGTLSLPGLPFVPPAGSITARLVSVSVYMSSIESGAELYRQRLEAFLELGLQMAQTEAAAELHEDGLPQPQWQT